MNLSFRDARPTLPRVMLALAILMPLQMFAPSVAAAKKNKRSAAAKRAKAEAVRAAPPPTAPSAPVEPKTAEIDVPAVPARTPGRPSNREVVKQESNIEFDERLVQGQRAAGAIYLFQRGDTEFRSLVQVPDGFLDRSINPIAPQRTK